MDFPFPAPVCRSRPPSRPPSFNPGFFPSFLPSLVPAWRACVPWPPRRRDIARGGAEREWSIASANSADEITSTPCDCKFALLILLWLSVTCKLSTPCRAYFSQRFFTYLYDFQLIGRPLEQAGKWLKGVRGRGERERGRRRWPPTGLPSDRAIGSTTSFLPAFASDVNVPQGDERPC